MYVNKHESWASRWDEKEFLDTCRPWSRPQLQLGIYILPCQDVPDPEMTVVPGVRDYGEVVRRHAWSVEE